MKKLMIAAVAAVVCGAALADGECVPVSRSTADVYTLKLTGKTTKGTKNSSTVGGGVCVPGTPGAVVPRVPAKLKMAGWLAACPFDCGEINTEAATAYAFWTMKPYKTPNTDHMLEWTVWNVIGKKQKQFEAAGTFTTTAYLADGYTQTYTLALAGLGKFNKKIGRPTKISGNFASTSVTYSYYVKNHECLPTIVWDCHDLATAIENVDTVAFGKWTLKRSSKASKKYLKGILPKVKNNAPVYPQA